MITPMQPQQQLATLQTITEVLRIWVGKSHRQARRLKSTLTPALFFAQLYSHVSKCQWKYAHDGLMLDASPLVTTSEDGRMHTLYTVVRGVDSGSGMTLWGLGTMDFTCIALLHQIAQKLQGGDCPEAS